MADERDFLYQFVICRDEFGHEYDFDITTADYAAALRPATRASVPITGWGEHRIKVADCEISFSYEPVGFQVVFETGAISWTDARGIVGDIADNLAVYTGHPIRVWE